MYEIGQHFIGGFEGTKITPTIKRLIQEYEIGGFILFRRNITSPKQVSHFIKQLQQLAKKPLLIGVDQEGGRVFRLKAPFHVLPPMQVLGDYYRQTGDTKLLYQLAKIVGKELKSVGFNWDFAPVVDVHSNPENPIIGDRSFGPDPKLVATCAGAFIRGLHDAFVLSCAKHFPGHGATSQDSHLRLPVLHSAGRLLWRRDIQPYRTLIRKKCLPAVMTAHVVYTKWDAKNCATLSAKILTGLLRQKMGFKGVVVSDDLLMKAVSKKYQPAESALKFLQAGGDVCLICTDPEAQIQAIKKVRAEMLQNAAFALQLKHSLARINTLRKGLNLRGGRSLAFLESLAHKKHVEGLLQKLNTKLSV